MLSYYYYYFFFLYRQATIESLYFNFRTRCSGRRKWQFFGSYLVGLIRDPKAYFDSCNTSVTTSSGLEPITYIFAVFNYNLRDIYSVFIYA